MQIEKIALLICFPEVLYLQSLILRAVLVNAVLGAEYLKQWAQRCCLSLWSDWYNANFQLIVRCLLSASCEIVLWDQLVYFQRDEGIVFGTQDNLVFSGLTVSSLQCQVLRGGETAPVLVRPWFLLIHVVLGFPASGVLPAAFSVSQPWSQWPAGADRCAGWSQRPGRSQPFGLIPHGSCCCRRGLRCSSRQ